MFNFTKITSLIQNIPNIAQFNQNTSQMPFENLTNQQGYVSYKAPRKQTGRVSPPRQEKRQQPIKQEKKQNKNKKDDDDNNNGGGFLEPIIQDLQGFLRGRRHIPNTFAL